MRDDWPLVGRQEEMELLHQVLNDDAVGGVVVAGSAGVGKTRLALDALQLARDAGLTTQRLHASNAASSVPFGAFASLLPSPSPRLDDLLTLLQWFVRDLSARSDGNRWVLLVDDVQWLDDPSAALVQQLAAHSPVFVVATLRVGEPSPDAITAIWKEGYAPRVDLQPLSLTDTGALLAAVLGDPADGATLRTLWEVTRGNALYLRELILGALASGRLNQRQRTWVLDDSLGIPTRLAELLESRFTTASIPELRAVQTIAIAGSSGSNVLESLWGGGVVLELEEKGLVEVTREERRRTVRLIHPMYGELLREQTSPALAAELSERFVSFTESCGARRRDDALRLATLSMQTGAPIAGEVLVKGAEDALATFDNQLAEALASRAVTEGVEDAAPLLCEALFRQRKHIELEDVFPELERLVTTERTKVLLASFRCDNLAYRLGRAEEAREVIIRAEAITTDEELLAGLAGQKATIALHCQGAPEDALTAVTHLMSDEAATWYRDAVLRSGQAETFTGRASRALALIDRAAQAAKGKQGQSVWWHPATIPLFRVHCLLTLGELDAAEAEATSGYEEAIHQNDRDFQVRFGIALATVCCMQGRVRPAARFADEAAALDIGTEGREGLARWSLGVAALARASYGDVEGSDDAIRRLESLPVVMRLLDGETVERGRAWSAAAAGDLSRSRRILTAAAEDARRHGRFFQEAVLLHDLARLGYASDVRARMRELVDVVEGRLIVALGEHVEARCFDDPVELEQAAISLESLGAKLFAAEAFLAASVKFRSAGLERRASGCLRRGEHLLRECEASGGPATRESSPTVQSLTRREVEVATLAATLTPSKEIAERLFVSVRTVNNLLQRVYTKLGVSSRAELQTALKQVQPGPTVGRKRR